MRSRRRPTSRRTPDPSSFTAPTIRALASTGPMIRARSERRDLTCWCSGQVGFRRSRVGAQLAKARVVARHDEAEPLAQCRDVGPVRLVHRIAGVKSYEPLRRYAAHHAALDRTLAPQRLGRVVLAVGCRSVDPAAMLVEHHDVEVDLMSGVVTQHEVPLP